MVTGFIHQKTEPYMCENAASVAIWNWLFEFCMDMEELLWQVELSMNSDSLEAGRVWTRFPHFNIVTKFVWS